ncbi:MAG: 4Fe-4S dicluster domain-containing protein [Planctomycetota bacterium]
MSRISNERESDEPADPTVAVERFLLRCDLDKLIQLLIADGFDVVGPTIDQEAIVYRELQSADDLPIGWTDLQEPGKYRLQRRDDKAAFGYVVGPHSWKKFLFPPVSIVASADRTESGWTMNTPVADHRRFAFLGVRACELAAMRIQDQVFAGGPFVDPVYHKRRSEAFIVAVNCTQAASTCFCTSMNSGPECRSGFDLALTEISEGFLITSGSQSGVDLMFRLPLVEATEARCQQAASARRRAEEQVTKRMDTNQLRELLMNNLRHPHWDDVATRCLSCSNCTMVCPTCFCSSVSEVTDLAGDHVDRQRTWDSCFNIDFSYLNGVPVRNSIMSRYRQWMTHKLSTWHDQFGTSGCVGCGRCVTWCPVGIDLTQEVAAIRSTDGQQKRELTEVLSHTDNEGA